MLRPWGRENPPERPIFQTPEGVFRAWSSLQYYPGVRAETGETELLSKRDPDFRDAARSGRINGLHDPFDVSAQRGPLLVANYNKSDSPAVQILLITHVFVGRQQDIEAGGFSSR